jgi:hypothetical protein
MLALYYILMHMLKTLIWRHLIPELTVIAPLDSRLCILNQVKHFSTHLRPAKEKPYGYTFALRS